MITLTTPELEELVGMIEEPHIQATTGLKIFEGRDKEKVAMYSKRCLDMMISGDLAEGFDYYDREKSVNPEYLLRNLSEEDKREYAIKYVQVKFNELIEGKTSFQSERLSRVLNITRDCKVLEETKEAALGYFSSGLKKAEKPQTLDQFRTILEGLVQVSSGYKITDDRLSRLKQVKEVISPNPFEKVKIEGKELDNALKQALKIARKISTENPYQLSGLVNNPRFQELYSKDKTARKFAKNLAETYLLSGNLETADKLFSIYGLTDIESSSYTAALKNLEQGSFEICQELKDKYRVELGLEDISSCRSKLEEKLKNSCKTGNPDEMIKDGLRLKSLDSYLANGLSIEQVPETDLPDNYSGKFVLIEFKDRIFLRGIKGNGDWHENAYNEFQEELRIFGFKDNTRIRGGAHFYTDKERKVIVSGDSGDYGECDKAKAKELLERYYPGKTVIAHASNGGGW